MTVFKKTNKKNYSNNPSRLSLRGNGFSFFLFLLVFLAFSVFIVMTIRERWIKNQTVPLSQLEIKIDQMVTGHPIEAMVPFIAQKNQEVAAFLVAIAKKESNWGEHTPKKDGRECFNYWGYRGSYNPTNSGYSCFDSPEQAVAEVGGRIEELLSQKINTPREMVVWKCGSDCEAAGGQAAARKWIRDVDYYFRKINK